MYLEEETQLYVPHANTRMSPRKNDLSRQRLLFVSETKLDCKIHEEKKRKKTMYKLSFQVLPLRLAVWISLVNLLYMAYMDSESLSMMLYSV